MATTTEEKTIIDLIKYPNEIDNDPFMQMIGENDYVIDGVIRQIMIEALHLLEQKESVEHRAKEFPDYELILERQDIALGNLICRAHRLIQHKSDLSSCAEATLKPDDD